MITQIIYRISCLIAIQLLQFSQIIRPRACFPKSSDMETVPVIC